MRAIRAVAPGGPEVLQVVAEPDPEPGPGEVLIEVHAAALNRADLLQRRGSYPPPPGTTAVLGLECSGVVTRVGPGTSIALVGQRVMALLPGGGYAELVAVPERMALSFPTALSFVEAAAVPEAFMTASEALFELPHLLPGEVTLVNAAAGGIGSATVQLAVAEGARVFGVAGTRRKCDFVRGLGAECFNHRELDFAEALTERVGKRGVDVIVDCIGGSHLARHQALLTDNGRLVVVGLLGGSRAELDLSLLLRRRQQILGLVMRTRSQQDKIAIAQRFARRVLPLLDTGRVRPVVDRIFELSQAAEAHAYLETNQNIGKVVLRVR